MKLKTPKIKLSWSRYNCWKNKEQYYKRYILGERYSNGYMEFGKVFHELLEKGEDTKDERLEKLKAFLPDYKKREVVVETKYKNIPLISVFDGLSAGKIGDYKFSKSWTQRQADNSEQLTFYAFVYWLKYKKIPKLYIHWIETEEVGGDLDITGSGQTFATKRSMADLMSFSRKIEKTYKEIVNFTKKEYAKI